jgi:molecular chaperone GrpE (heat shock protein)
VAAVSEKDEEPAQLADQPAGPPPAAQPSGLTELADRLSQVEEQLAEFHRRSAHRESVIDRLHEENQQLRSGFGRLVLDPVVTDLIRLYDQLTREGRHLDADGQDAHMTWSFAEDVLQILDRCGIEAFSAEPGDPFARDRHRPLAVVPCDDEGRHNTVAEVVAIGFTERATGRVRRPVQARFYQYPGGQDGGSPSHEEDGGSPGRDAAQAQ